MINMTNITNANNVLSIIGATNEAAGGMFFAILFPMLFLIFLFVFKGRDMKKVLLADSFFMIILTGIAWAMSWVGWSYVIIPVVFFGGSIIAYQFMD